MQMLKLNVKCEECGKGKLQSPDAHELFADYFTVECDACDNTFSTHYTGFDSILAESEYNNQVCEDVRLLNENGSWISEKQNMKKNQIDEITKGFDLIQKVETAVGDLYYYRSGSEFYFVIESGSYSIAKYVAHETSLNILIAHFFQTA
jgi:hypothetical protein